MTSRLIKLRRDSSRLCLLSLGLIVTQRGAAQPVKLPQDIETNFFSMTVKVVDAATEKPLENSVVMLPNFFPRSGRTTTNEWRFPTDAQGVALVRIPAEAVAVTYFSLVVSNASHPAKHANWNVHPRAASAVLPKEFTFRMERGGTIGGFVRDERGELVPGVKVVPWGNGAGTYRNGAMDGKPREYSVLSRNDNAGVITDAKGFWQFTQYPPDVTWLNIDVVRPDGSRSLHTTPDPTQQGFVRPGEEVKLDALLATNAVLVLKDGASIRGVVVDESGKPVPNAVVSERAGDGWEWTMPIQKFTNDAQGRFVLPHRAISQYLLTAEAEDYAVNSVAVTVAPDMPEAKLVLSPARPLKLRLLDEEDRPVAGAEFSLPEYRNLGHLLTWKGTSGADGRVMWSSAPRQPVSVQIVPTNHPPRMVRVESLATEQIVRVWKEPRTNITVRLRVMAEGTREPVVRFGVWRDLRPNSELTDANWTGTNGEFRAELNLVDFPEGSGGGYRLQVRAEGYAPQSVDILYFDEGDFDAPMLLKKSKAPTGVVLLPDGQPAAEAKVMLSSENQSIFIRPMDNYNPPRASVMVKSDADGRFKIDAADDEQRVVVLHPAGFAAVSIEELRQSGKIQLMAYARLEGKIGNVGKSSGRQYINLKSPLAWGANEGYQISFGTDSEPDGRFVFTNIPPGEYMLYRIPFVINGSSNPESYRMPVHFKPGETMILDYAFGGRTVVGRVEADGEIDWRNDSHALSVKLPALPPGPNYFVYANTKEWEKARRAHGKSKAVLDYERKKQQFQLVFDKEGNFKVDDVPPGTYELSLRATKPNKNAGRNSYQRSEEVIGSLKRDITIPAGTAGEEFDLGTLEMEVKESLGTVSAPLDFTAEELDGKPFKLVSLRGKPAIVVFWGMWAPGSLAKLESVQTAVAKLEADGRPALVTVNLDSSNEAAREGVKNLGAGWVHTRLAGTAMFEATERLSVDTLPMVLLLDAQGRVMGRDMDGKRLASSVKRMAAGKN